MRDPLIEWMERHPPNFTLVVLAILAVLAIVALVEAVF